MSKFFRYIFIAFDAVIILLVAVVAIFVAVFDANAYKQDLSNLVLEEAGLIAATVMRCVCRRCQLYCQTPRDLLL